jgi:ABC-2 type transport system permease protein
MSTGSRLSRSAGTTPVRSPDNRHRLSDKRPPRNPKRYLSVFRIRFTSSLQYRTAALAGVATQFFWGFVLIMVYIAFYSSSDLEPPISLPQLVTYVWLQQSFLAFIMLWYRDDELFRLITTGNIAYELCRPGELYGFWYAKLLAQRMAGALLRCLPILVAASFLPSPYRMMLPPDFLSGVLFIISLLLGLLVLVAISMFIYISVFYTMSPYGSLLMFTVVGEFLAGMIIPVPLMPEWLQDVVYLFPFSWTADFPFRVYSGHFSRTEAAIGILLQLVWLVVLVTTGRRLMLRALRRVVVQGG